MNANGNYDIHLEMQSEIDRRMVSPDKETIQLLKQLPMLAAATGLCYERDLERSSYYSISNVKRKGHRTHWRGSCSISPDERGIIARVSGGGRIFVESMIRREEIEGMIKKGSVMRT